MKTIITVLLLLSTSLNAQIEKVWEVRIDNVIADPSSMGAWHSSLYVSLSGTVLLSIPFTGLVFQGPEFDNYPSTAWITSDGKVKHIWRYGDNPPGKSAILSMNDDYIVTYTHALERGGAWVWSIENEEVKTTKNDEIFAGLWFAPGQSQSYPQDGTFFGINAPLPQGKGYVVLTKYRTQTKSPTLTIQRSEDLDTWQDLLTLPKSGSPTEFFRIAPGE